MALVRTRGGKCQDVVDKAAALENRACGSLVWLTTALSRTDAWTLRLSARLPSGHWVAYARAFNTAGVFGEGDDGKLFSVGRGDERHFGVAP